MNAEAGTSPGPRRRSAPLADRWMALRTVHRRSALAIAVLGVTYVAAHALLLRRFPWFVDETYFAMLAQAAQSDPSQRFGALVDHKGLLPMWLGALQVRFDIPPMDAMRLLSAASGAVTAAASAVLVGRWYAWRLAVPVAAVVAFVPYLFVHDTLGVYDSMIAAGSMVALCLQLELARRPRLDLAMILGFTLGALLLTKPTGALAILLMPLTLVVMDWGREGRGRRLAAWGGCVVVALVIAAAAYSLTYLSPLAYTPAPDNHRTISDFLHHPFAEVGRIWRDVWRASWGYLTPPGLLLAVWGCLRAIRGRDRVGLVLVCWALAALAAFLLLTDTAYPRYGLQMVAPLCILGVVGVDDLLARARDHGHPRIARGVVVLALLPAVVLDVRILLRPTDAPYPGLDRRQYVGLISNSEPTRLAARRVVELSPATWPPGTTDAERTVVATGGFPWGVKLVLSGTHLAREPRFVYLDGYGDQAAVNAARWIIVEGALEPTVNLRGARIVGRWKRPDGGPETVLYRRR